MPTILFGKSWLRGQGMGIVYRMQHAYPQGLSVHLPGKRKQAHPSPEHRGFGLRISHLECPLPSFPAAHSPCPFLLYPKARLSASWTQTQECGFHCHCLYGTKFYYFFYSFVCMDVWRPGVGIQCLLHLLLFNINIIVIVIVILSHPGHHHFGFVYFFFKAGFFCEALAVQEFTLQTRLTSNSQRSSHLCLPNAGIKRTYHSTWLNLILFYYFIFKDNSSLCSLGCSV